ncbi:hydantoinase B/oxoprolinase family protein, partial [Litorivicinus sp.]|nr:hydantoinase B/oxoprolinase family protein [Litorivicinus sp.]
MSSVFDNEIIGAMARGIVDDMQAGLFRSGYSAIIRESHDASCAILTAEGALAAQKVVLPIHVGAFPAVIEGVLNRFPKEQIEPGDCFVSNSPWEGGSPHNPDFAVVSPVFFKDQLVAFTASIAHKSDIGGPAAGSCPATAPDMYSEGLHIPPVKLYVRGELNAAVET